MKPQCLNITYANTAVPHFIFSFEFSASSCSLNGLAFSHTHFITCNEFSSALAGEACGLTLLSWRRSGHEMRSTDLNLDLR